jgi:hypothetical protein
MAEGTEWQAPRVWVATELDGKILVSEIELRRDKLLQVIDGRLLVRMKEGRADLGIYLGIFFGMAALPDTLATVMPDIKGREVYVIPLSGK